MSYDEEVFGPRGGGAGSPVRTLTAAGPGAPMTKPRLLALSTALYRTMSSSIGLALATARTGGAPPLVVAFFQQACYFEDERLRFEALGALGVTTIVGFPGEAGKLPDNVEHVDLRGRPELEDAWVLATFDGTFGAAIVAVDDKGLVDGPTLESSRRFVARVTVEPAEARAAIRQLLSPLRARIGRRSLARVEAALDANVDEREEDAQVWLETFVGELVPEFEIAEAPSGRDDIAETDLLTGVRNRIFLDRYLPRRGESAAQVAAVLVDVDDLGILNTTHGPEAGDAALVAVARALAGECRRGDVLVRYGADEFVVLAAANGPETPIGFARRLVVAVRAARLDYPFGAETVTISAGVTVADPAALPLGRLRAAVDGAKALGKDLARLSE